MGVRRLIIPHLTLRQPVLGNFGAHPIAAHLQNTSRLSLIAASLTQCLRDEALFEFIQRCLATDFMRAKSVDMPECGNNLLQIALLPFKFRDYA